MKVQTVATTTMHRMDHGCVPDPEGETFHALLSAIRAINPSALSSLSTQPAQTMMSTDYEALYEVLCSGGHAHGFVDGEKHLPAFVWSDGELWKLAYRGGYTQGSLKETLVDQCQRLCLQWVAPLPSQTEGLDKEAIERQTMIDVELAYPDPMLESFNGPRSLEWWKEECEKASIRRNAAYPLLLRERLSLPRQKGEVDMETVIDIRAAIIELMGTGVKVPTTEELISYMATSPK